MDQNPPPVASQPRDATGPCQPARPLNGQIAFQVRNGLQDRLPVPVPHLPVTLFCTDVRSGLPLLRSVSRAPWLLLVAVFWLGACTGFRPPNTPGLAPFTSDGCSLFPDGPRTDRDRWCECCQTHDLAYWQGGSEEQREQADAALRDCVLLRTGDSQLAATMHAGVRAGGHPVFPSGFRWGYGWPYGRGYEPLSNDEKRQVEDQLARYAKQHPTGYCAEREKAR